MQTTEPHPDPTARRVLPQSPYATLTEYEAFGGGKGLRAARAVSPETVIDELVASGLR